jgi:hypothetical protein
MRTTIKPKLCLRWRSESGRGYCRRRDAYYETAKHRIRKALLKRINDGRMSPPDDGSQATGKEAVEEYFGSRRRLYKPGQGSYTELTFNTARWAAIVTRYAAKLMVHDSIAAEE